MNYKIPRRKRRDDARKPAVKSILTPQAKRDRAIAFKAALEVLG